MIRAFVVESLGEICGVFQNLDALRQDFFPTGAGSAGMHTLCYDSTLEDRCLELSRVKGARRRYDAARFRDVNSDLTRMHV
jgi:hypothetical protein